MGLIEALTRAQTLRRDNSPGSKGIRVGKCRRCRGWHLTTRPRIWRRMWR